MYKDIFNQIIDASKKNTLTFFVGAGISRLSNAPTWSELVDKISIELGNPPQESYSSDELLRIPQTYYYSIKNDNSKYYSFITKSLKYSNLQPNIIHKMLFDLMPNSFVTTNYDELLEQSSIQFCQCFKSVACDNEISNINGDKFILKIHGDIKHKNIVLKEEDYLNYSENFKLIETLLKSIFSTNTIVFIGYGINDYNVKLILNWSKNLLKENFDKPIFIYTGDDKLSKSDLIYYESRGLKVIEYYKFDDYIDISTEERFMNRYKFVIQKIDDFNNRAIMSKSKIENFEAIYSLLKPLDQLKALRITDIKERLFDFVILEERGIIRKYYNKPDYFEYFIEINKMNEEQKCHVSPDHLKKYKMILRVLSKARIFYNKTSFGIEPINDVNKLFANELCLTFNYKSMQNYIRQKSTSIESDYLKAYYLAKLKKYSESFQLFTKVAIESFENQQYMLHYFSQINRKNIYKIVTLLKQDDKIDDIERIKLGKGFTGHLFDNLPYEFQREYHSLKNLDSADFLYKNSYESFIDSTKLQKSIDKNTTEMGMSSSNLVMCRINSNLHFLLGNGLYIDEYDEFKNVIQHQMANLLYKYSAQNRLPFHDSLFPDFKDEIIFDVIDFYCFIEYFKKDDLKYWIKKYDIDEIKFNNIDDICICISNLFDYYDSVVSKSHNWFELDHFESKLQNCLELIKYICVPQNTIDYICKIVFKYEYRHISISDKISFLDYTIYRKGMNSSIASKILANKLIFYCDRHLNSTKEKPF